MNDSQDLERTARRRAGAKLGWLVHAMVYVCVNLLLAGIAFAAGRGWAIYPALGWGLGLLVHGFVVFIVTGGGGVYAQLVDHERSRLQLQRDPW
ncbi:2TM domain-containing protein [Ramlibacter humi]|uniref:2TM domain-containing protein n=1 Tax=Ramlibacter humi TaxID=2530451 RepID=A0A4Z0CD40_9BURK|nr:2TM domain-containing protein [Ramlibacter humi]TFZ08882.1 2TM domain-containing protein [Ramlibacter humi]